MELVRQEDFVMVQEVCVVVNCLLVLTALETTQLVMGLVQLDKLVV